VRFAAQTQGVVGPVTVAAAIAKRLKTIKEMGNRRPAWDRPRGIFRAPSLQQDWRDKEWRGKTGGTQKGAHASEKVNQKNLEMSSGIG